MKLLFCSDIHDNISSVRKMRAQETNDFDAVIVAGDIGGDKAQDTLAILSSFECPVLYVYGNWDYALAYDASFGPNCHHLHLAPFQCGLLAFVGFSGCPTHWGQNPIALRMNCLIDEAHHETISALKELTDTKASIEACYNSDVIELKNQAAASRKPPSQTKLRSLEVKRDRTARILTRQIDKFKKSASYNAYVGQREAIRGDILAQNRRALLETIGSMTTPIEQTIIVTHERLAKATNQFSGVSHVRVRP